MQARRKDPRKAAQSIPRAQPSPAPAQAPTPARARYTARVSSESSARPSVIAAVADSASDQSRLPSLAVIVPVYNESAQALQLKQRLARLTAFPHLLVDGGSSDDTVSQLLDTQALPTLHAHAQQGRYRLLRGATGRAVQMNLGAKHVQADVLLFLHADTTFTPEQAHAVTQAVAQGADFGCFSLRIDSCRPLLRVVGGLISLRSHLLTSATGDQAIFMRRSLFEQLRGYRELALCEDLDLIRRASSCGRFVCLPTPVSTSARRWEQRGLARTIALMWALRVACHAGVDPQTLRRIYEDVR